MKSNKKRACRKYPANLAASFSKVNCSFLTEIRCQLHGEYPPRQAWSRAYDETKRVLAQYFSEKEAAQ